MMKKTILSLVVIEFVPRFLTGDNVWFADDIIDSIQVIALCWLLAGYVKRNVAAWCLVVAYGACETIEAASNVCWYWFNLYNLYLDTLRVIIALAVLIYYQSRRYNVPSDTPCDDAMYLTYHRPRTLQDRCLALFGVPLGGVGLYTRGKWYRYSHGKFVISECKPGKNHVIIRSGEYDPRVIQQLTELVGTKWGILNNCMTEILPLVKLGRRLALTRKPHN